MSKNLVRGLVLALSFSILPPSRAAEPLKVAFVYVSPVGQAGWSYQHDLGRQAMAQALGARVRTRVVEAVPEGPDSERVMRDLAAQGCGLIARQGRDATDRRRSMSADMSASRCPCMRSRAAGNTISSSVARCPA